MEGLAIPGKVILETLIVSMVGTMRAPKWKSRLVVSEALGKGCISGMVVYHREAVRFPAAGKQREKEEGVKVLLSQSMTQ